MADALMGTSDEAVTRRVVMFSGGVGSWYAARRVKERHGVDGMTLLFADTLIEDEDTYRFLVEAARDIGAPLVRVADGRTPWEVFKDVKYLGNSRVDPCSRILKREQCDKWLRENCDPSATIVYVGIDWTEFNRFDDGKGGGVRPRKLEAGWVYEAPLCERPYVSKPEMFKAMADAGIRRSRSYEMGFSHDNCGGFCIKGGEGHFGRLLKYRPERYGEHEREEKGLRAYLGKDVAIMRDRRGGKTRPMTMEEFRKRVEAANDYDQLDIGGCGCFFN